MEVTGVQASRATSVRWGGVQEHVGGVCRCLGHLRNKDVCIKGIRLCVSRAGDRVCEVRGAVPGPHEYSWGKCMCKGHSVICGLRI